MARQRVTLLTAATPIGNPTTLDRTSSIKNTKSRLCWRIHEHVNRRAHNRFVWMIRFSSSVQFNTTLICAGAVSSCLIIKKCCPSAVTS